MVSMARVAINGGVSNLVTMMPFMILQMTATTMETINANSNRPVCL